MQLRLTALADTLAVCRLPADDPPPAWAAGELVAVTRTPDELSVVCRDRDVPSDVRAERGWRSLRVEGPLAFELTGVIAELTRLLAGAGVPVFVLSTFDTDYVLVKADRLEEACTAVRLGGHLVDGR